MHQRQRVVLGADLDGESLRIVRLLNRSVSTVQVANVTSPAEVASVLRESSAAVEGERGSRLSAAVMSWSSAGVAVRRTSVQETTGRGLPMVAAVALDRLFPSGADLPGAGMLIRVAEPLGGLVTVGAVTSEHAAQVRQELADTAWRIVPAPMTLRHEGLHLALRRSSVELSLVREGVVVTSRQFRTGGLSAAEQGEAFGTALAPMALERLDEDGDPQALVVARRFVAAVARELHRSVANWERSGLRCGRSVWVHGPGATLPNIPSFLTSVGFTVGQAPLDDDVAAEALGAAPLASYAAVSAALSAVDDEVGFVGFLDAAPSRRLAVRSLRRTPSPTRDPMAGFEGVLAVSGRRDFVAPRLSAHGGNDLFSGAGLAVVAIAVAFAFGVVGWVQTTRSLDRSTFDLRSAQEAEASARAQVEWAADVQTAAAEIRDIAPASGSGWDVALGRLQLVSRFLPPLHSTELEEIETGVTVGARLLVATSAAAPVTDADIAAWTTALAGVGRVTSSRRMQEVATSGAPFVELVVEIDVSNPVLVTP